MKNKQTEAGQAVYSKIVLSIYDIWVLGFSNSFIWRCPTKILKNHLSQHVTLNHLDAGVGTGYFLDKCLSNAERRVALMDLNQNSLKFSSDRISRFKPEIYHHNVLEPLNSPCEKFDSISINYLLHCLPGNFDNKTIIFKHLNSLLNSGGTIFGSTILGKGIKKGYLAGKLMVIYNKKGIFDNLSDDLSALESSLKKNFSDVDIKTRGCVAVFSAKKK